MIAFTFNGSFFSGQVLRDEALVSRLIKTSIRCLETMCNTTNTHGTT